MFKLFKRLTSKEIGLILMTVVFICLTVYLELEVPTYMSEITTLLQTPGTTTGDLWVPGLKMLGLSFASLFSLVIAGFVSSRMASSYTTRLREDIFNRVLDYSDSEIKKFSIPSLLTRTTNDITQIQVFIAMGLQVVMGYDEGCWQIRCLVDRCFSRGCSHYINDDCLSDFGFSKAIYCTNLDR